MPLPYPTRRNLTPATRTANWIVSKMQFEQIQRCDIHRTNVYYPSNRLEEYQLQG
jgi:hypothetical protein